MTKKKKKIAKSETISVPIPKFGITQFWNQRDAHAIKREVWIRRNALNLALDLNSGLIKLVFDIMSFHIPKLFYFFNLENNYTL